MASNEQEFKTAIFEDGTCAVLRADPAKPHLMEVIATFHDAALAREYVRLQSNSSGQHQEKRAVVRQASAAKPTQTSAATASKAAQAKPIGASAAKPRLAAKSTPKLVSQTKPVRETATKPAPATQTKPQLASAAKPTRAAEAKPKTAASNVSERQAAVLKALHSKMDKKNLVEVTVGELAKASSTPLGSVHSVLVSLEKKGMIKTERQGSAKFRAIYQVLETPNKGARSVNSLAHGKETHTRTVAH